MDFLALIGYLFLCFWLCMFLVLFFIHIIKAIIIMRSDQRITARLKRPNIKIALSRKRILTQDYYVGGVRYACHKNRENMWMDWWEQQFEQATGSDIVRAEMMVVVKAASERQYRRVTLNGRNMRLCDIPYKYLREYNMRMGLDTTELPEYTYVLPSQEAVRVAFTFDGEETYTPTLSRALPPLYGYSVAA